MAKGLNRLVKGVRANDLGRWDAGWSQRRLELPARFLGKAHHGGMGSVLATALWMMQEQNSFFGMKAGDKKKPVLCPLLMTPEKMVDGYRCVGIVPSSLSKIALALRSCLNHPTLRTKSETNLFRAESATCATQRWLCSCSCWWPAAVDVLVLVGGKLLMQLMVARKWSVQLMVGRKR